MRFCALLAATLFLPAAVPAQQTVTGQAAFADWDQQQPGIRRKITLADLPEPRPDEAVDNTPHLIPRPVLRGVGSDGRAAQIEKFTTGLDHPFGIAFYPAENPKYIYVGNTATRAAFSLDTRRRGRPNLVRDSTRPESPLPDWGTTPGNAIPPPNLRTRNFLCECHAQVCACALAARPLATTRALADGHRVPSALIWEA